MSRHTTLHLFFFFELVGLLLSSSQFVNGSNNEPPPEGDIYYLEPITVTAEKRPSELQKTPIPITTFTSDEIQNSGITSVPDLSLKTPGLTIGNNSNVSVPEIFIRGIGTTDFSTGSDISVGIYVDDVYIGRGESMFFELFDLERIEILRGPQGTLYGRNTIGGAVNLITNRPTNDFTTMQQLKYGSFDLFNVQGMISGPIIKKKVLGRVAYSYKDRDGYTENVFNGDEIGDADSYGGRGSLWLIPSEELNYLLSVDYFKDRPSGTVYKPEQTDSSVADSLGTLGQLGLINSDKVHTEPDDKYKVNQDTKSKNNREIFGISGKLTWDLNDLSLVMINSFRNLNDDVLEEVDATSFQLLNFQQSIDQEQMSHELRLTNNSGDQLDWIIGAFIFREKSDDTNTVIAQDFELLFGPGNYSSTNFVDVESESYAIFGQGTYAFTDRLSLTLGLRYTYEEKDFDFLRVSNADALVSNIAPKKEDETWDALTPKFTLGYQYADDLLFYGTISRGFKSGGFNSIQLEDEFQGPFDPEYLWAYEIGVKSKWFGQRLQLNVAAFYYDHSDLQVQKLTKDPDGGLPIPITDNASEAEEFGFEIEGQARPINGLDIIAGIGVLDAEYKDFVDEAGNDFSENELNRSPKLTTNLAIQYVFSLLDVGYIVLRGEHQYQSKIYFTETNENILSQKGFHNIKARVGYESLSGRFSLAYFGDNLTDEETVNVAIDLRDRFGEVTRSFNPPRTHGVEVTYRF